MLEDPKINIKLKLSALWTSLVGLFIYGDYFELYVPGKVEKLINETSKLDNSALLLTASISIAIPCFMIALSVILKPKINKVLNIVFASLIVSIVILVGSTSVGRTSVHEWYRFYVLYAILEAIILFSIINIAWKWPKRNAAQEGA